MAQLKDLLVIGDARVNGTLYANFNRLNVNGLFTATGGAVCPLPKEADSGQPGDPGGQFPDHRQL